MSCSNGPNIVTSGLVFEYDMANDKKSWKGMPLTNLAGSNFFSGNGNFTTNTTIRDELPDGTIGDVRYLDAEYVYDGNRTVGIGNYTMTAGTTYTISFYVKNISCTGFGGNLYCPTLGRVIGGITYPTITTTSWTRVVTTFTIPSEGYATVTLAPQVFRDGGYGFFKMCWLQVEQNTFASPYVNSTRSNTQAILDLTGNNTITANSLTYNSNGSFSFDGSTNYLQIPYSSLLSPTSAITLSVWATTDWQTTNSVRLLSKTESGGWQLSINDDPAGNRVGMTIHVGGTYRYCTVLKTSIVSGYHNLVGTCDGRYLYLYIDGIQVSSLDLGSTMALTYSFNNDLIIGAEAGGAGPAGSNYITGSINDVKIYNRALSAQEVKQNFNALRSRYGI